MKKVMHILPNESLDWAQFAPNGKHLTTRTESGTVRAWPVYDSPQALIDTARAQATRELNDAQREQFNLVQEE